jgi:translation initiation factor 1A
MPGVAPRLQVIRMLGNGRLEAQCIDGKKRLCHIRGKMRKKVWVGQVRIVAFCG